MVRHCRTGAAAARPAGAGTALPVATERRHPGDLHPAGGLRPRSPRPRQRPAAGAPAGPAQRPPAGLRLWRGRAGRCTQAPLPIEPGDPARRRRLRPGQQPADAGAQRSRGRGHCRQRDRVRPRGTERHHQQPAFPPGRAHRLPGQREPAGPGRPAPRQGWRAAPGRQQLSQVSAVDRAPPRSLSHPGRGRWFPHLQRTALNGVASNAAHGHNGARPRGVVSRERPARPVCVNTLAPQSMAHATQGLLRQTCGLTRPMTRTTSPGGGKVVRVISRVDPPL
ncbi:conserved protein of unknown function [Ectopseudomonas oleovorans]|uniref:Uncharacterized protein n=1 Tax=Ectopseudomonas oleovorans TaxID=301 RepID=A0A653B280_ECTOL|nr:conserved protein of unknown function [Pseudomonas oleovorans]